MARHNSDSVNDVLKDWLSELGLCDAFKLTANLNFAPEAYNAALHYKRLIKRMGICAAFAAAVETLLYTGPRHEVNKTIDNGIKPLFAISSRRNHKKAEFLASKYGYVLLEQTPVGLAIDDFKRKRNGKHVLKISVFQHLEETLQKTYTCKGAGLKKFVQGQIDNVMGFVSAAFLLSSSGNVDTLVCGASPTKVFYLFELPALMQNRKITAINGVKKDEFLKIYNSGAKDASYLTYRKICETEIDRLNKLAKANGPKSREWQIWEEQKDLFDADHKQYQFIHVCKAVLKQKKVSMKVASCSP